jgi:hypothetical protein
MAGEFQNLTGKKLARAAVTATMAIVYETPANTRAYIKDIMVTNHSGSGGASGNISIHIVAAGSTATFGNVIIDEYIIAKQEYLHWSGLQITDPGDTIEVLSDATRLSITISGAEAV